MLVADEASVLAHERALVQAHHKRTMGADMPEDEATNIHIGDIVGTPESTSPKTDSSTPKPGLSPLVSGLIGAGLLASGIGIPAGAYFIADAIKNIKPSETVVTPVTPGDGNTQYDLRLIP